MPERHPMTTLATTASRATTAHRLVAAALALAVLVSLAGNAVGNPAAGAAPRDLMDDETVYAVLAPDGSVQKTVVVDWLSFTGNGSYELTDPGAFTSVRALEEEMDPQIADGAVTWALEADGRRDFFYRAETEKALPLAVETTYLLDGVEMDPADIAGRDGRLEIRISVKNRLERTSPVEYVGADGVRHTREETYWVPLLVVTQFELDGRKFSDIEEDADVLNVTGSTMGFTYMLFPQNEDTATIAMTGTDIELPPIYISAFPQMPGAPEIEVADTLDELYDGVDGLRQLSEGHVLVLDGLIAGFEEMPTGELAGAADDFAALGDGLGELGAGVDGLTLLAQSQYDYLDGLIAGIDTEQFASITDLVTGLQQLAAALRLQADSLEAMLAPFDGHVATLQALQTSNSQLSAMASALASASPDATTQALAAGLAQQDAMLSALVDGSVVGTAAVPGVPALVTSLHDLSTGLGQTADGLDAIAAQAVMLNDVPTAFERLHEGLVVLRDGGTVLGQQFPGLGETVAGLAEVSGGVGEMAQGVAQNEDLLADIETLPEDMDLLVQTITALRDGGELEGVYLPGVTTTAESLAAMGEGLADGVTEARVGEGLTEVMEDEAAAYDTFLGKPEGAKGRVRFVMKLPGIQKPDE
ncbi:MAG: hypothetical protein Kow0056_12460 [Coriobacteriia bacterium]